MPFIVPGVARYSVNGTIGGREVVNIIDMFIDTTGSTSDRETSIFEQCGILINEWSDHILNWTCNSYQATSISWVDLDDADGSTGERSVTDQETWPQVGAETQPSSPPNTSMLWTKLAEGGRSTRNGRSYLVGIPEAQTDAANPALLSGAFVTARQDDAESFLGNINQTDDGIIDYDSWMVVTRVLTRGPGSGSNPGPPLTGEGRRVTALRVEQRLATQRRRLRG